MILFLSQSSHSLGFRSHVSFSHHYQRQQHWQNGQQRQQRQHWQQNCPTTDYNVGKRSITFQKLYQKLLQFTQNDRKAFIKNSFVLKPNIWTDVAAAASFVSWLVVAFRSRRRQLSKISAEKNYSVAFFLSFVDAPLHQLLISRSLNSRLAPRTILNFLHSSSDLQG